MTNQRLVILVIAVAIVSIVAVVVSGGGDGEDEESESARATETAAATRPAEPERPAEPHRPEIPDDPEDVLGTAEYALTRPRNLAAALEVLQAEAAKFEGRPDSLRIAPGRIDTTLQRSERRKNLQIRADLKIPFSNEFDFPTNPQQLARGLRTREVDPQMPRRILNAIDLVRPRKSAARDLDYMVVSKSIIDGRLQWSAYLQSGPRPRQFSVEGGARRIRLRAIG